MLTESLGRFFEQSGAEWVLWLLLVLSVVSVVVMVERALFLRRARVDYSALVDGLTAALGQGLEATRAVVDGQSRGIAHAALSTALDAWTDRADSIADLVAATITAERLRYERNLSILGTIAANAPFLGLLGTIIGVLNAFGQLAGALEGQSRTELVMGSIAEALVATAVGLAVAIPAVVAYNYFKRRTRVATQEADALAKLVIARRRAGESGQEGA
jgi:biopolymer transport protein ExbB